MEYKGVIPVGRRSDVDICVIKVLDLDACSNCLLIPGPELISGIFRSFLVV